MIKVIVVDDHDMVRRGLIAFLETEPDLKVVGEGSSGKEAIELVKNLNPDVVLMVLIMENGNGIEATTEIMKHYPDKKIIILTSFYDDEQVFPAIQAGAFSYLLKTAKATEITDAIIKAYQGVTVIEPKVASKMMNRFRNQEKLLHQDLTEREMDVLLCLGDGLTNQEIAEELFIGIKTVKTHVSNILSKLDVADRTQAAIYANRNDLIRKKKELKWLIKPSL
ncbi:response regulator transcription factor [Litchfieldia alkalitelluris]|uniref:response regulator transcription factor n=1 Tax=Litchfieldia alkalitelluris TaxID=304268 RepID=UPI000997DC0E|nr:response regulator transcription factor [Litchfieldia alkalitelluris]